MPTKSKSNTIPKARIYCPSCGRTLGEERFYFIRGTHGASAADRCLPICKDCCMNHYEAANPASFMVLLFRLNLPWIPQLYAQCYNEKVSPQAPNSPAIFGRYLTMLRLSQYKTYQFKDSLAAQVYYFGADPNFSPDAPQNYDFNTPLFEGDVLPAYPDLPPVEAALSMTAAPKQEASMGLELRDRYFEAAAPGYIASRDGAAVNLTSNGNIPAVGTVFSTKVPDIEGVAQSNGDVHYDCGQVPVEVPSFVSHNSQLDSPDFTPNFEDPLSDDFVARSTLSPKDPDFSETEDPISTLVSAHREYLVLAPYYRKDSIPLPQTPELEAAAIELSTEKLKEASKPNQFSSAFGLKNIAPAAGSGAAALSKFLTAEELQFLQAKWGLAYTEEELVYMEKFYIQMTQDYDIRTAPQKDYLKKLCVVSLRYDQATERNDFDIARKASEMYSRITKEAGFQPTQAREEEEAGLNAIGLLVKMCEAKQFIPKFVVDEPQDQVDFVLKDLELFTKRLVDNDDTITSRVATAVAALEEQDKQLSNAEVAEEDESTDYNAPMIVAEDDAPLDSIFAELGDSAMAATVAKKRGKTNLFEEKE